MKMYEKALEFHKNNIHACYGMLKIFMRMQLWGPAYDTALFLLDRDVYYGPTSFQLARLHAMHGRYDLANKYLQYASVAKSVGILSEMKIKTEMNRINKIKKNLTRLTTRAKLFRQQYPNCKKWFRLGKFCGYKAKSNGQRVYLRERNFDDVVLLSQLCNYCEKDGKDEKKWLMWQCNGCGVRYCCRRHQKRDWVENDHRFYCVAYKRRLGWRYDSIKY